MALRGRGAPTHPGPIQASEIIPVKSLSAVLAFCSRRPVSCGFPLFTQGILILGYWRITTVLRDFRADLSFTHGGGRLPSGTVGVVISTMLACLAGYAVRSRCDEKQVTVIVAALWAGVGYWIWEIDRVLGVAGSITGYV